MPTEKLLKKLEARQRADEMWEAYNEHLAAGRYEKAADAKRMALSFEKEAQ